MTCASFLLAISFLPFFEAKNSTANLIVSPPAEGHATITLQRPQPRLRETCPACDGKGEIILKEENFGQSNGRIGGGRTERRKCSLCGGTRKLEAFMNPNELNLQVAKDFERYSAAHLAKGELPVGLAFVPRAVYEQADAKLLKAVEEAFSQPCTACNWTGLEPCRKCSGQGFIPCTNSDCKGGWSVVKTTTSYSRTKSGGSNRNSGTYSRGFSSSSGSRRISRKEEKVNVHVCTTCEGARLIRCPECQGQRARTCHRCNGIGTKRKGLGL